MNKILKWVIIVSISMTILICLGVAFLGGDDEQAQDLDAIYTDVASTVMMSFTQTAAGDPNSIHTQVAGTMMAKAKQEPTATQTIEPTKNQETDDLLLEYFDDMMFRSDGCSSSLTDLGEMTTELSEDFYLLYDSTWLTELESTLLLAEAYCTTLGWENNVPTGFEESNSYLLMASQEYSECFRLYRAGINNMDANAFTQSTAHLETASTYMDQATNSILEWLGE